jgi:catechol 2,3-dioxygenase-like lactoylglutathione lyase family enzyme
VLLIVAAFPALLVAQSSTNGRALEVGPVVMTVANMDRLVEFYTRVLAFEKQSDVERSGPAVDALYGVPNAQVRAVDLKLGYETIELLQFIGTVGTPMPIDARSNDLSFQHVAIIVSDMDRAYAVLRQNNVQHISPYPQRLPDWNPNASGIKAFYFRDPDGHPLEILQFPPGKGDPKWQVSNGRLFLGNQSAYCPWARQPKVFALREHSTKARSKKFLLEISSPAASRICIGVKLV